jgi:hypothetical protein
MRLTDLFVNDGPRHPLGQRDLQAAFAADIRTNLDLFTVVEATNVYEYVKGLPGGDLYELPCAAPPHDLMLIEWRQHNGKGVLIEAMAHDGVLDGHFLIGNQQELPQVGANGYRPLRRPTPPVCGRCAAGKHDKCLDRGYWIDWENRRTSSGPECSCDCWREGRGHPHPDMWLSNHLPDQAAWDNVRWTWRLDMYQEDHGTIYGPLSMTHAALDRWGQLLDVTYELTVPNEELLEAVTLHPFSVFLHTLNFMQCANIRTVYVQPPEKLARKHRKRGHVKQGLVGYHVLRISPSGPAQQSRSNGNGEASGLVAFHPVRGEFHHYGDCCPGLHPPKGLLFGRHTGRFWVPAHVRGNPERGVIVRDFELEPVEDVPWKPMTGPGGSPGATTA